MSARIAAMMAWTAAAFMVAVVPGAQAQSSVEQAYKRELAFLQSEKRSLEKRLRGVQQERETKVGQARAEVEALQQKVTQVSLQADRLQEQLQQAEQTVTDYEEGADVLDNVIHQAASRLEKAGITLPGAKEAEQAEEKEAEAAEEGATGSEEKADVVERIDFVFDESIEVLDRYDEVRETQGSFFLEGGKKVDGTLVHVGRIATYGVSEKGSGALAPAGQGRLKLWPGEKAADVAHALAAGKRPDTLEIFVYESLDKGIEKQKEKTALQVIQSGGIIAWVIVGLGAVVALMMLLRALLLALNATNTTKLVDRVTPHVADGDIEGAVAICNKARNAPGRVLRTTLRNLHRTREHLDDIISESILQEQPVLDRFGAAILVIAAVAPLLGLLGTVTGMISTFDVITEFGTGNPKLLSGGISEALVTTQLGLIVAIPSLLVGNLLSGWAEGIKDDMDKAALRVTNVAEGREGGRPSSPTPSERAPAPSSDLVPAE